MAVRTVQYAIIVSAKAYSCNLCTHSDAYERVHKLCGDIRYDIKLSCSQWCAVDATGLANVGAVLV